MCATTETPASTVPQPPLSPAAAEKERPAPRPRRKGALLPQIYDLALDGHGCREIGARLGLGKSTVHRWLRELRRECRSNVVDVPEMLYIAVARYNAIYREAMEAWRNSKADKEAPPAEETAAGGGAAAKTKRPAPAERRAGNIAFLAQARNAVAAICKLLPAEPWPSPMDTPTYQQFIDMTNEEVHELAARVLAGPEQLEKDGAAPTGK